MSSRIAPLVALIAGTLFGAGLALGGMVDPVRVRGFLDLFGAWDPTLAFVMAGAVAVMAVAPLCDECFHVPEKRGLDAKLIGGAALFGVGWGIAGLCPGPGIAAFAIEPTSALVFTVCLLAGMGLVHLFEARTQR